MNHVIQHGRAGVTAMLTMASVIISLTMTVGSALLFGVEIDVSMVVYPTVIPVFVVPLVSWFYVRLVVELARTRELVKYHAQTDDLTGLSNRRHFTSSATEAITQAQLSMAPVSASIIDVDSFKAVNDTYGHLIGDNVLKHVASVIRDSTRQTDICGRFGGDEFVVVLPNTAASEAGVFVDRIRKEVYRRIQEAEGIEVTLSIGVAGVGVGVDSAPTLDDLLILADQNLYSAKRLGKNQVSVDHKRVEEQIEASHQTV